MRNRLRLAGGLMLGYGLVAGALWAQFADLRLQPVLELAAGVVASISVVVLCVKRQPSWLPLPLFAVAIALAAGATGTATLGAAVGLATLSTAWTIERSKV